jgi:predicted alpha/beta hydrolase
MTGYSSAPWQAVDLDPRMYGREAFGHLGYFRAGSERLWLEVLDRLRLEESRH